MVFDATNLNRRAIMFAGNSANVCPNTIFDFNVNPIFTFFRAENNVIKN